MENNIRKRAVGIVIKDEKIILMRRVRADRGEYYIFPGGGVEEGENLEQALEREMMEELSITIKNPKPIFAMNHRGNGTGPFDDWIHDGQYFLIEDFDGVPELGGPEKEHMNEDNQFYIETFDIRDLAKLENIYPREAAKKILEFLDKKS